MMNTQADVLTQTLPVADEPSLHEGHMHSGLLVTAGLPDLSPPSPGRPPYASPQDRDTSKDEETDTESNQPLHSPSESAASLPATAPPTPTPLSPTLPPTSAPDDVWNYSFPVLGSQKKNRIYYKAPFQWGPWPQEEWTKRFEVVTKQLEHLVKRLRLVDTDSLPTYLPRMVGTCPSDARPSVVVICREAEFKSIRDEFQSRGAMAKALWVGKEPVVARLLSPFTRRAERDEDVMPRLQLVYYRTSSAINRNALDEPLSANIGGRGLTCGGIIRYGKRTATLGVAIEVGDRTGILTVDHLFSSKATTHQPPPAPNSESASSDESEKPVLADSEWANSDSLWEDDDEYDDLDTDQLAEAMDLDSPDPEPFQLAPASNTPWKTLTDPDLETWDRLASSAQLISGPYLDWALTSPRPFGSAVSHFVVNTVFPGSPKSRLEVLQSFHTAPTAHLAPVYIVSGIRGIIYGEILFAPSFIPSFLRHEPCEVWTVIPDAFNDGIVNGECGSVVVDRATDKVYGHVVGSDSFGHAYVVPLAHVLAQVRDCFPGSPSLPKLAASNSLQRRSNAEVGAWDSALDNLEPGDVMDDVHQASFGTHPLTETNLSAWQKTQESTLANRPNALRLNHASKEHLETSSSIAVGPPSTTRSAAPSISTQNASERHHAADAWLPKTRTTSDGAVRIKEVIVRRLARFHPLQPLRFSNARDLSGSTTYSDLEPSSPLASTYGDGSGAPYQVYSHPGTNYVRCISPLYDDDPLHMFSGSEASSPPQYAKELDEADLWGGSTATDQSVEERDVWGLESPFWDMDPAHRLYEESEHP